jgi:hypothetical protein
LYCELLEKSNYNKVILLCDRGAMDFKAYVNEDDYKKIFTEYIDDRIFYERYDLVIHLETTAKYSLNSYGYDNNPARTASIKEAIDFDDNILEAWKEHKNRYIVKSYDTFEEKKESVIKVIDNYLSNLL